MKCGNCDGCGRIADSDAGEPWSEWMELPVGSSAAVIAGIVKPIKCAYCDGSGKRPVTRRQEDAG